MPSQGHTHGKNNDLLNPYLGISNNLANELATQRDFDMPRYITLVRRKSSTACFFTVKMI